MKCLMPDTVTILVGLERVSTASLPALEHKLNDAFVQSIQGLDRCRGEQAPVSVFIVSLNR